MVFLLPASPVHAASPTVSLSTISSGKLTAVTSGTVDETIVVTGTGFAPASPIAITTTVGTTTVPWLTPNAGCTATLANSGTSSLEANPVDSLVSVATGCLTTTASGNFQVEVEVPNLPGGAQTISVSDGVNTGTATFTITPSITLSTVGTTNYGFPEETVTPTITVWGFGANEVVTVSETVFATTSYPCTTGNSVGFYGTCVANAAATTVADTTGGSHTITATGATSGDTATTTFTVNPWIAFYNSAHGQTTFSFIGTAPTSILVEAHGLAAGTIAGNSMTMGGTATNHASVTVGASGTIYGLVVSPNANVPYGLVISVLQGDTFSYAAGNIAIHVAVGGVNTWGGALISSVEGTGSTTGVASTDASSYKPGIQLFSSVTYSPAPVQGQIAFFGYGFVPAPLCGGLAGGALSVATPAGATFTGGVVFQQGASPTLGDADCNGAFFATTQLGDTPWSSAASPSTAKSYTPTVSQLAVTPSNILSPSFGITPWVDTTLGATTVDYTTANFAINVHGFGATDTVSITIGGAAMILGGTIAVANGGGTTAAGTVPDLAGGAQNVVATGSISGQTSTATGAVTYAPIVNSLPGAPPVGVSALSINQGGAGQTTVARTGNGYGIHGLLANTAYNIVWNAISGSTTLGTFTSTATGGIPIPGTQVTIPSDSSGVHILDIQTAAGASAIFGSLLLGQLTPADNIPPANFPNGAYTSGFGDLLFSNIALLQAAPSVATIGSPVTISGTGLAAGGAYVIALGTAVAGIVLTTAPALGTFTATASGSVPSSTSITLGDTGTTIETGTVEYFSIQTTAHYGTTGVEDAYAEFVLASSAKLNMTSAPTGHSVILTAHALNPTAVYDIIFNYVQSAFNPLAYTGTTVGVIAPNGVGAGSATFAVPAGAATGATVVQLVVGTKGAGGAVVGTAILNTPLSLTVGSVSTTSCNTTSCMAVTGTPAQSTQGAYSGISSSFTNNSNAPVTGFVYAVVHNALGQTVDISTATISAPAGGSVSAFNALFGLPPGTYSVSLFVTSSAGTAISSTSTVSVTIP